MRKGLQILGFVLVAVVAGGIGSTAQTVVFQKLKFFATSSAADALKSTGGYTAGSGAVPIINTAGKIPALNSTYVADTTTLVPSNLIAFTDAGSCPSGWSEFTSARGRYIVGLPSGGTNLATVGTALSNSENRPIGQHSHTVTDPGHAHNNVSDPVAGGGAQTAYLTTSNTASSILTGSAVTGLTVDTAGSVSGTNAPYIQLMACKKS